ncbi:beta-d-glucosyl crocetin beta-1 6-glucosyltransferase [Phtheirospermum japonicum]|uniref:Glycosyltransferase n=1 Tax=Phtheirospermum japonicum TaxID=374723 RepID=A0A830B2P5_9LAMI|nr:beta-d-glucosyl crocetin beta-1 6-glucosyltransferase [Phtheirospermum japonicum]
MFPWLAHGHIYPFLELAKRLSTRNFNIYLCSTPINLDSIKPSIEKDYSSIKLVELHVPSTPSPELPPEMHTTKNLPSNLKPTLIKAFQMSSPNFSDILDSVKPDLLVYDMYQPWAPKLASSKGIPSVYFSTSGATLFSFFHHMYTMGLSSPFPYEAIYLLDHEKINLNKYNVTPLIKDAGEGFACGNFDLSTNIVLVNGSRQVEDKYIDYLSVLSKKRIVSTGPLIAHANNNNYDDDYDADDHYDDNEIMKWLSEKNKCSTVYISFGSEYFLSREQIAEIAKGILLSKVNFLWIIRFPNGEKTARVEEALPKGFLEAVKERGRVTEKWAPQTKILAHPSIGGFVSHCGWSSIMESMYFAVPVIGMPMKSDQPVNARLVVEDGVGVEVEKDKNGNYSGDEVAKAINKVMAETESYEGMRDRVKRLSQKIKENEENEVNETAEQLLRICVKKTQI